MNDVQSFDVHSKSQEFDPRPYKNLLVYLI